MPLPIICPSCQQQLTVADQHIGQKVSCPKCRTVIETGPFGVPEVHAISPAPIVFFCPACGSKIIAQANQHGEKKFCQCGQKVQVPDPGRNKTVLGSFVEPELQRPSQPVVAPVPVAIRPMPLPPDPVSTGPKFNCPYCKSDTIPMRRNRITQAGWLVFFLLLFGTCGLLCWIPLIVMRESYRRCTYCGMEM